MRLSNFELDVMACFWSSERLTAPQVFKLCGAARGVTYSTIKTIIDRLEAKGALARMGNEGRTICYQAAVKREKVRKSLVKSFLRHRNSLARLIHDSHSARYMGFTSTIRTGKHDVARVAALGRIPRLNVRAFIGAALCAMGLGAAAPLNAQSDTDPRIGSWDELKTSSHYDSLLRVFRTLDNGMIRMEINFKLLEVNRWHVDFRCDGGKYRTLTNDGKFVGSTYSCRRTGARTFEISFTYGPADAGVDRRGIGMGQTFGTGTEEVSADGKYYKTTGVTRLSNGEVQEAHREFVRRN